MSKFVSLSAGRMYIKKQGEKKKRESVVVVVMIFLGRATVVVYLFLKARLFFYLSQHGRVLASPFRSNNKKSEIQRQTRDSNACVIGDSRKWLYTMDSGFCSFGRACSGNVYGI